MAIGGTTPYNVTQIVELRFIRSPRYITVLTDALLFSGAPTLEATPLEPLLAVGGDAVLIDCVVRNLDNYTVGDSFFFFGL